MTYVVRAAVVFHTTSLEEMRCGNSGSVDLRNQTRGCESGVGARDETVGVAQRNISLIMKPSYQWKTGGHHGSASSWPY